MTMTGRTFEGTFATRSLWRVVEGFLGPNHDLIAVRNTSRHMRSVSMPPEVLQACFQCAICDTTEKRYGGRIAAQCDGSLPIILCERCQVYYCRRCNLCRTMRPIYYMRPYVEYPLPRATKLWLYRRCAIGNCVETGGGVHRNNLPWRHQNEYDYFTYSFNARVRLVTGLTGLNEQKTSRRDDMPSPRAVVCGMRRHFSGAGAEQISMVAAKIKCDHEHPYAHGSEAYIEALTFTCKQWDP